MTITALPTSSDVQAAELHALQAVALALRDLIEATGADAATITFTDGTLTFDEDGCHILPADGGAPVDLTDWIDYTGMVVT